MRARQFTPGQKRASLAAVLSCLIVTNVTFSISAPIFPQEAARHGVGATAVGVIFSSFSFVDFFSSIAFGKLLQRRVLSRRLTLAGGILALAVGTALFGLVARLPSRASFIAVCLALRLIEGVACAAVDTSATAITAALYKDSPHFGAVMGFSESMISIGWVAGPVVGGSLATVYGFGAPFYAVGLLALVFTPISLLMLPADEDPDLRGRRGARTQLRTLITHPPVIILAISAIVAATMITWVDPVLAPHLEDIGFSIADIGFLFGVQAVIYGLWSPAAGWGGDKVGRAPVIIAGLLGSCVANLILGPLPWLHLRAGGHSSVWVAITILGVASACAFTPIMPAVMEASQTKAGRRQEGLEDLVAGIVSGCFYLGCGIGPLAGGSLTDLTGFAWTASLLAAVVGAQGAVVLIMSISAKCRPTTEEPHSALSDTLLPPGRVNSLGASVEAL